MFEESSHLTVSIYENRHRQKAKFCFILSFLLLVMPKQAQKFCYFFSTTIYARTGSCHQVKQQMFEESSHLTVSIYTNRHRRNAKFCFILSYLLPVMPKQAHLKFCYFFRTTIYARTGSCHQVKQQMFEESSHLTVSIYTNRHRRKAKFCSILALLLPVMPEQAHSKCFYFVL